MIFHLLPKTKDIYLSWISQILRKPYFNFCDRKIFEGEGAVWQLDWRAALRVRDPYLVNELL